MNFSKRNPRFLALKEKPAFFSRERDVAKRREEKNLQWEKKILLFVALSIIASRFAIIPSGQGNGETKKKKEKETRREEKRVTP